MKLSLCYFLDNSVPNVSSQESLEESTVSPTSSCMTPREESIKSKKHHKSKRTSKNSKKHSETKEFHDNIHTEDDEVLVGAGGTTLPRSEYEKLDFRRMKYIIAVRRLLNLKFNREELGMHSQTGKESPAYRSQSKKTTESIT
ncbi:hypothetical protein HHI36_005859 [Cryptolaemus montrouzieri]|uniref:Uncharacterized protein n=1 Tax=Cryptolaemus montrouzieri TaxID=559131 RepID=A0ABD2NVN4_9CUCU